MYFLCIHIIDVFAAESFVPRTNLVAVDNCYKIILCYTKCDKGASLA